MRRLFVETAVIATLLMPAQGANLVVNGSFEAEAVPVNSYLAGTTPTGWLSYGLQSPDILTVGYSGGSAAEGTDFVDLIGVNAGVFPAGIRQDISLLGGVTYAVSFAYNGDFNSPRSLEYSVGALLVGLLDVSNLNAFTDFGATTVWQQFTAQVTPATTGSYTLALYTTAGSFGSPYVDDVSVTAVSVPEVPVSAATLGLGLAICLSLRLRRR